MDNKKRTALLKLGYFPVTDDFWSGADMGWVIGKGYGWAIRMPNNKAQKFMPYHESVLESATIEENRKRAIQHVMQIY